MKLSLIILLVLINILGNAGIMQAQETGKKQDNRYEFTHPAMGTLFRIITYAEDEVTARDAALEAFNRIDELNSIFSDYIPDSECMQLSRKSGSGSYEKISKDMYKVLELSLEWSEKTGGTFDVTVGSLSQLWRRATRKGELPEQEEIDKAMSSVGYQFIRLDPQTKSLLLEKAGTYLDFGGIAKGYTVDQVYMIFNNYGLQSTLVDGGGDIYAGKRPPDRKGWKIMIRNLDKNEKYVLIENQGIATSGDLYRFFEAGGKKYSHIIDPKNGYGLSVARSVTVMSDNVTTADIMASALSVSGPEGFSRLQDSDFKAVIIQEVDGKLQKWEWGKLRVFE